MGETKEVLEASVEGNIAGGRVVDGFVSVC